MSSPNSSLFFEEVNVIWDFEKTQLRVDAFFTEDNFRKEAHLIFEHIRP